MGKMKEIEMQVIGGIKDLAEDLIRDNCSPSRVIEITGLSLDDVNEVLKKVYSEKFGKEHEIKDKLVAARVLLDKRKLSVIEIASLIDLPEEEIVLMKEENDKLTQEEKDRMVLEREVKQIEGIR